MLTRGRLRSVVAAACAVGMLAMAMVLGPADPAAAGSYGPPEWAPLRDTTTLGCTYQRPECSGAHTEWAIDVPMEINQPIYAAGRGQVVIVEKNQGGNCPQSQYPGGPDTCPNGKKGNAILINHGSYGYTLYGHMSTVLVNEGQWVDEGTVIAGAGNSGWTPPSFVHLHYEEWDAGSLINGQGQWDPPPKVQPRDWKACHGASTVRYPDVLGYSSWASVPFGSSLRNDGGCNPNGPTCITGFIDVLDSHPFCTEIDWMVEEEITTGYSDGLFKPTNSTSRQAAVTFLYRLAGEPPGPWPNPGFSDVSQSHPFYDAIAWGVANGLVEGYSDGTFKGTRDLSRQAMMSWLWGFAGEPPGPWPNPGFSDVLQSHPFYDAIAWGVANGITDGYPDDTFRGSADVTRQGASAFLFRYDSLT